MKSLNAFKDILEGIYEINEKNNEKSIFRVTKHIGTYGMLCRDTKLGLEF